MENKNEVIEKCDYIHAHEDIIKKVEELMPDEELLYDLSELFKVFGDSTRIRMLYVLSVGNVRMRPCDNSRNDAVGNFSSAESVETKQARQMQTGRQVGLLFSCRQSCKNDFRARS